MPISWHCLSVSRRRAMRIRTIVKFELVCLINRWALLILQIVDQVSSYRCTGPINAKRCNCAGREKMQVVRPQITKRLTVKICIENSVSFYPKLVVYLSTAKLISCWFFGLVEDSNYCGWEHIRLLQKMQLLSDCVKFKKKQHLIRCTVPSCFFYIMVKAVFSMYDVLHKP